METPESSDILRFDWNDEILTVEFRKSGVYNYHSVPEWLFQQMEIADSKGKFLNRYIKGKFNYDRS